jgi:hypothetical protein
MSKMENKPYITPRMKVFELLKHFPEVEEYLIQLVPAFSKLRNPLLRKTITRVTTLEQAAKVAEIDVEKLINSLRERVGQDKIEEILISSKIDSNQENTTWFDPNRIVAGMDVREMIERGEHPISLVLEAVEKLNRNEIFELVTSFVPAPLIEMIQNRGFKVFIKKESSGIVKTYFFKP